MRGAWLTGALLLASAGSASAQKAPEMGYVYPPGGRAGQTLDVRVCGYDWTPDMQFFTLTPGVKLEITGPPGPILVPPPPYWFGAKAYLTALPLPREVPARLTLPAGLPPGPIRWQAANANGGTATGVFIVSGEGAEVTEQPHRRAPQPLAALPATVNGRLEKNEEVDRYRFTPTRTGPVTVELTARGLGANFNGMLEVRDSAGHMVADAADTTGHDAAVTFPATAGTEYTLALHDVDFRGDRSYVYRLGVRPGPRVLATLPAAGMRGQASAVEFLLDTGEKTPERVKREVHLPAGPGAVSFPYRLELEGGSAVPVSLRLSDVPEATATATLTLPGAVTGTLDEQHSEARFKIPGKMGEVWKLAAEARALGSALDVSLRVLGPDGKELAKSDDLPDTTDAGLDYTVPADGEYTLVVNDLSGGRSAVPGVFRLSVERAAPDFRLQAPQNFSVQLGGSAELVVKAIRSGGFKDAIPLTFTGLPEGVSVPADAAIPAGAGEVKVPLRCAADAPATASLAGITGTATIDGKAITHPALAAAAGNLVPNAPDDDRVPQILVSVTMKPVAKVEPVDKDGGRRIHRGATYPAAVIVTRSEGFQGEVGLWMAAHQSYTCMGISGPDMVVAPGVSRSAYPCFMPEWLETSRTSRMITVAVAKVADPRGHVRHLLTLMDGRITMAIEGALLKVTHHPEERTVRAGASFRVPVKIARSPDLPLPVRVTLVLPEELQGMVQAEPLQLEPGKSDGEITLTTTANPALLGDQVLTFRATAMQPGELAVVSETQVPVLFVD
jgi:hypothetical protein